MKVVAVILLVLVAERIAQETVDDQREKVRKYREECVAETGVDTVLIERADNGDFADDPKLKCFSRCFYQKAGFVDDEGQLLFDVIKAKIPQESDREKALAIIEKCKEEKGSDSCETVYLVHKCYFLTIRQERGE